MYIKTNCEGQLKARKNAEESSKMGKVVILASY